MNEDLSPIENEVIFDHSTIPPNQNLLICDSSMLGEKFQNIFSQMVGLLVLYHGRIHEKSPKDPKETNKVRDLFHQLPKQLGYQMVG